MRIYTEHLRLRLTRPGQLVPWLGLALRGLVGGRFKEKVCRHSPRERIERWVHCTGCPHLAECSYGQTFEPDPPAGVEVFRGQEDTARPLVLAPSFPLPDWGEPGGEVPLKLLCVGQEAARHAAVVREVLVEVGAEGRLGPDRIPFRVLPDAAQPPTIEELSAHELPPRPDALPGRLPRVGVGLTGPLLLKQRDEGNRRQTNQRPQFSDLFRAALRTVGRLFTLQGEALTVDFRALAAAAEEVRLVDDCYEPFQQDRWSSRQERHYRVHAVVGGGVYTDVPLSLLPWLLWGGRLHVGSHRMAGAGGWRLVLD